MIRHWIAAALAMLLVPQAEAAMQWQPAPPAHGGQVHGRHAGQQFLLQDSNGATAVLIDPRLAGSRLTLRDGLATVSPTGNDNYHALVAERSTPGSHEIAIRYVYLHGKPSGRSPAELTVLPKAPLEIVPAPLPREHWRYLSGEETGFVIRFNGRPLPEAVVELATTNGSRHEYRADRQGRLLLTLPDDFADIGEGRRGNRPADLLLTASHEEAGKRFVSTLSADYHVNPSHWQSTPLGAATMLGGMALGGVLTVGLRRRSNGQGNRRKEEK